VALRRTSHPAYDRKYYLVWTAKYRKWIMRGAVQEKARAILEKISVISNFIKYHRKQEKSPEQLGLFGKSYFFNVFFLALI
jgi:hypothetical protein